jgi:hypothetical protein
MNPNLPDRRDFNDREFYDWYNSVINVIVEYDMLTRNDMANKTNAEYRDWFEAMNRSHMRRDGRLKEEYDPLYDSMINTAMCYSPLDYFYGNGRKYSGLQ